MSLTSILLYATSVLAVFSGFSAFIGASKTDKKKMAWFFATTIMAAIWNLPSLESGCSVGNIQLAKF